MLLGLTLCIIVSFLLGHHVGKRYGYEQALIDITNVGVDCDGSCKNCITQCNIANYVESVHVERIDE